MDYQHLLTLAISNDIEKKLLTKTRKGSAQKKAK